MRTDVFGWFDKPENEQPTHDPGLAAICPICGKQLEKPIKTISLMKQGDSKSYFYRTHKTCYDNLSEEEICQIESSLIDPLD